MKRLLYPVLIIIFVACGSAFAQVANLVPYYFPESEQWTLVLDFQSHRSELAQLSKEVRSLALAKDLLREFKANGSEKCPEAKNARLLAVFIPGTDNYGRPDFGARVNLLLLEGSKERVLSGAERNFTSVEQLNDLFAATVF